MPPLLDVSDVHKRFGGARALRGAQLQVGPGEVHGLLGQNGSGKSTLLRILSGQIRPDAGRIWLDGEPLAPKHPPDAIACGVVTVTQETTLVPGLSVAENVLLGHRAVRRRRGIDWRSTRRRAVELLDRLQFHVDPDALAGGLRPDQQQIVEIARALSMNARLLLLDEPTSSLTDDDVERLFRVVRGLRDHGVSTIFVSHRMSEVFDVVDRLTILRNGETVDSAPIAEFDARRVIRSMVGQEPELGRRAAPARREGGARLRLRGVSARHFDDVSLDVAAGEVVGLAGLVGAGRSKLLEALFGLDPSLHGDVEVDGRPVVLTSPRRAMAAGIAYVPADRKTRGLALEMRVDENLMMARTAAVARARRPRRGEERAVLRDVSGRLGIVGSSPGAPVRTLSGGNQQKVLLAKWLGCQPRVLLLDEPTRGVDVGAKEEIHRILDHAREAGMAVLVSSSEGEELQRLCDRVHVLFRGCISATLHRGDVTDAAIAHYATGHR